MRRHWPFKRPAFRDELYSSIQGGFDFMHVRDGEAGRGLKRIHRAPKKLVHKLAELVGRKR